MTSYLQTGMVQGGAATAEDLTALRDIFIGIEGIFDFLPGAPWLELAGQTLNVSDYPKLAAKRGETGSTFSLPDLRGRVVAGLDTMGGVAANRLTEANGLNGSQLRAAAGAQVHTLTTGQMPSHSHSLTMNAVPPHSHTISNFTNPSGAAGSADRWAAGGGTISTNDAGGHTPSGTIGSAGSGQAHNNVQPTIIQYICILAE